MNDVDKERLRRLKELEDAHDAAFEGEALPPGQYTVEQIVARNTEAEMCHIKEDYFDDNREAINAGDVGSLAALRADPDLIRLRGEIEWLAQAKLGRIPGVVADKGRLDLETYQKTRMLLAAIDVAIWPNATPLVKPADADTYTKTYGGNDG